MPCSACSDVVVLRLLCLLAVLVLSAGVDAKCENRASGERWSTGPPEECARYKCNEDGTMSAVNCAVYLAPKEAGCKLRAVPPGSKYPECCPHYDC